MCKKILLIGGGGHCRSVLDTLLEANEYDDIGIIDAASKIGQEIFGIKYIGSDDDLKRLYYEGYKYAFITLGSVGNTELRQNIAKDIADMGFIVPNIISTSAAVGKEVKLGSGVYIGKNSVINCYTVVDDFCIINSGAVIEHDCTIGKFVHAASGCVICGQVVVGSSTHIGANSTIRQGIKIGENSIIGAGSVVVTNIKSSTVAYGNPCREVQ